MSKNSAGRGIVDGTYSGTFRFASGTEAPGQLTLAGRRTAVLAWEDEFSIFHGDYRNMVGELHDMRKVSLIDCQDQQMGDGALSFGGLFLGPPDRQGRLATRHFVQLDPRYVLLGDYGLWPSEAVIRRIHFTPDDANALFPDDRIIGYVAGETGNKRIEEIAKEIMRDGGSLNDGDVAQKIRACEINFAMVRREPFADVLTPIGNVRVWHRMESTGDAGSRTLKNEIIVTLEFEEPCISIRPCTGRSVLSSSSARSREDRRTSSA